MATCPVRFEFNCENTSNKLIYIHNIPRSLVRLDAQVAQNEAGYVNRFQSAILPIMKEHEAACLALSRSIRSSTHDLWLSKAENLANTSTFYLTSVIISWLHINRVY